MNEQPTDLQNQVSKLLFVAEAFYRLNLECPQQPIDIVWDTVASTILIAQKYDVVYRKYDSWDRTDKYMYDYLYKCSSEQGECIFSWDQIQKFIKNEVHNPAKNAGVYLDSNGKLVAINLEITELTIKKWVLLNWSSEIAPRIPA